MDEMITAPYTWTDADYVDVCVAKHRYSMRGPIVGFARIFAGLVVLVCVVVAVSARWGVMLNQRSILPDLAFPLLLVGGVWYLFYPRNFLNVLWYRHHCRSLPSAIRSIEWGFEPEQLWTRNELADSVIRWELFGTVVETPRCFLFYQGQHLLLWLPARAFSSPGMLRMFTDLARAKVPHYVVLGVCQFLAKPEPVGLEEL